jgi:hypothetical protein
MIGKKRLVVGLVVACVVTFALAVGSVQGMELAVRNASVYPPVGNWSDHFNYSVNVSFYKGIEIELWIYHPGENKWKPCETQKYNARSGEWQPLRWNIQPFSPGCKGETSSYEFWWNKEVLEIEGRKTFEGPHIIKIKEEFKNESVNPAYGYYNTPFTYSVWVKLNKEEEIALEIFNISSYKWEERGKNQSYNKTGDWQLLIWPNITHIASADCKGGLGKYRFFFIESGERYESDTFRDPTLKPTTIREEIFKNATVTPASGYYNIPFNYSVEVDTNGVVELMVYDITIDKWQNKIKGNKTGNRWEWRNITFSEDCAGVASYKFIAGTHESELYYGPTLKFTTPKEEIFKNATVTPAYVSYGYTAPFDYSVEANTSTSEDVVLMVYDISINDWLEKGNGNKTGDNKWEWKDISFSKGFTGLASYKFEAGMHESEIFYGPMSITSGGGGGGGGSSYKPYMLYESANVYPPDCTVKGAIESKTFNYTVEVDKGDTLILEIYNPSSEEWEEKGKGKESNMVLR